ncbi:DUF3445 multi-domain protein [Pyrenophora teres f. maculata]|nr:DUF3445 multi-domain protein [Pyrenophora teres f. maculata]
MSEESITHDPEPDPSSLYILLILVAGICGYFFFLGTAAVRLWFYKGALGPDPEKFILIRSEVLHTTTSPRFPPPISDLSARRRTVFHAESLAAPLSTEDTGHSTALSPRTFSTATTTVNMQDIGDDLSEIKDARVRKYIAEERRISRIPAFDADDCGDGEYFPLIPLATSPIEAPNPSSTSTPSLSSLGLIPIPYAHWLTIPPHYTTQHAARTHLLSTSRSACIQALPDADTACRELMLEVCDFLVEHYPQQFLYQKRGGRRWIRNEVTGEDFLLEAPWRVLPVEVVGRLTGVDWCIWGRSESTRMWYLQASATCFPAGYDIPSYIGKSVDAIVYGEKDKGPMLSWSALPDLLLHSHLIPNLSTSPQPAPTTLPSLITHIIQTSPPTHSLASTLHITRPIDFFAGNIANLHPSELLVRTSMQVFARLPKSGAVVVATRTETETLGAMASRMGRVEKEGFLKEVAGWGEEEARFKGRELWVGVVERVLRGEF